MLRLIFRVAHAKGAGAHGFFEVTDDISDLTYADVFSEIGKKNPALVRFSTVGGEKGSADTARDNHGFAVKLFTNEGNLDLVFSVTFFAYCRCSLTLLSSCFETPRNFPS